MKAKLEPKTLFDVDYLFIDGISRSGKSAIVPFVSSFENVEHWKQNFNLDKLHFLLDTGHISESGFRYFFETDLIMDTWFSMMGRNVNTNLHDLTSILNATDPQKYLNRFDKKDTPEVFAEIRKEVEENDYVFSYLTDDFVFQNKLIRKIVPRSKYLITVRHPIELIFAWERSGRGQRFGTDQRFLNPTFSTSNVKRIPHFALDVASNYSSANSVEKCVLSINILQEGYNDIFQQNIPGAMYVNFDKFIANPEPIISKMAQFIGKPELTNNEDLLKKCRLPRPMEKDLHHLKSKAIFSSIGEEYRQILLNLCEIHSDLYGNSYDLDYNDFKNICPEHINFKSITNDPKYINGQRIN